MAINVTQIVITARDNASATLKQINSNFDAMKAPIAGLTGMVAGLGAAFAGLSVVTSIKGALAMADEIGKLAQKTGVTVEAFSKLSYAAKLSDVSNEQLSTGLKKLGQNMAAAAAGSGEAQKYFHALGISVTDGAGKLKSADAVMGELAGKFSGMSDGATKTATAMGIFGKSGADLIPMLNSGADGIKSMADEAARLGLVMSDDMAKGAEQFNDNLTRLKSAGDGLTITLANQMLPGLTGITNAMVEAAKEGGLLSAVWVGLGGLGAALFTDEFDGPKKKIESLRKEMADWQEKSGRSKTGLIGRMLYGEVDEIEGHIEKTKKQIATLEKEIATAAQAGDKAAKERSAAEKKRAEETEARLKKQLAGSGSGGKKSIEDDYAKLSRQLSEQIALSDAALASTTHLTEGEKLQAKVLDDIVNGRVKLSAVEKKSVESALAELVAKQKLNLTNETARKLAKESIADKEKQVAEAYKHATAINDEAIKQEDANSVYGMGKAALEDLTIAKLEAKLASIDYADASFEEIDALEKEIAARKRLASAMRDTESKDNNAKAAKEAADAWQKSSDEINRSLTDALMRGFESGKGFAQNLVDTVKNMFNTMVLRPIVSAVLSPVSSAISSGMGAMGLSGQAAAGTDYMGMASNGSTMNSMYNMATGASQNTLSYGAFGTSAANVTGSNMVISGSAQEAMLAQQGMGGYSVAPGAASSMAAYGGAALGAYYGYQQHGIGGAAVYGTAGYVGGAAVAGGMAAAGGGMAAAGSGAMAGASGALTAIGPWGWAALAALAILGWDSGKSGGPKVGGGAWQDSTGDKVSDVHGNIINHTSSGGDPFNTAELTKAAVGQIAGISSAYGKELDKNFRFGLGVEQDPQGSAPGSVTYILGDTSRGGEQPAPLFAQQQIDGKDSAAAVAAISHTAQVGVIAALKELDLSPVITPLLDTIEGGTRLAADRVSMLNLDAEQAADVLNIVSSLSKTTVADIEKTFGQAFDVTDFDAFKQSGELTIQTFARLRTEFDLTNQVADLLGKDITSAFGAAGLASASVRESFIAAAGGMQNLAAMTQAYNANFYSQAEQTAQVWEQLDEVFNSLGMTAPRTKDEFRSLVSALDLSSASGQSAYVQLMNIQGAFAQLTPEVASAVTALTQSAEQLVAITQKQRSLDIELMTAKGDSTGALEAQRQMELDALKNTAGATEEQIARLIATQKLIYDATDASRAAAAAAEQQQAAAAAAQAAAEQAQAAAESLRQAWQSVSDAIFDEVARIRGLSANSAADAATQFAIATAQARAGDQSAAQLLPSLSQAMLTAAEALSSSALDMAVIRAQTASSLEMTGKTISMNYGTTIPAFAAGGDHDGGWAIVGENGPELLNMPPGRVFTNGDSSRMLDNTELLAEIKALRSEVAALRGSSDSTASTNEKISNILLRVTRDGESLVTVAA